MVGKIAETYRNTKHLSRFPRFPVNRILPMARAQLSCCYRGRILGQCCCRFRSYAWKEPCPNLPTHNKHLCRAKGRAHVRPRVYFKGRKNIPVRAEEGKSFGVIILTIDNNQHPDRERDKQSIIHIKAELSVMKEEVARLEEEYKIVFEMAKNYKMNWMATDRSLTLAEREIEEDSSYWGESMCFSQPRVYRESPPRRIE